MKKFVSVFLVLAVLLCGFPLDAFAAQPTDRPLSVKEVSRLNLKTTEVNDVFQTADGKYLAKESNMYIPVTKKDIPMKSEAAVKEAVGNTDYPKEMREAIQNYYEYVKSREFEDDVVMSVFSSNSFEPYIVEEGTNNSTGKEMRYHVVYYGTQPIETVTLHKGVDLANEIDQHVRLAVSVAPLGMLFVPPTAAGYVATNLFLSVAGATIGVADHIKNEYNISVITGQVNDFSEVNFNYRYYEKYVEVNTTSLGWCSALKTARAEVVEGNYRIVIHRSDGSLIDETLPIPSFVVQGESYNDPWQTAFNHMFLALHEDIAIELDDMVEVRFGDFIWL